MLYDDEDLASLPDCSEEAFVEYEKHIRHKYSQWVRDDRDQQDMNGNYVGSYEPERSYMNAILAFIDEYSLDIDVPDISEYDGEYYFNEFLKAKSSIEYVVTRFSLRKRRMQTGAAGTLIAISSSYKSEIGNLLEKIRKIVNQEVTDIKKKDEIFVKIAALQSEVDREQTTIDAFFGRMVDLAKTVGKCAEELKPLADILDKLKSKSIESPEQVDLLPKRERQKLIPDQSENSGSNDLDDEIPF